METQKGEKKIFQLKRKQCEQRHLGGHGRVEVNEETERVLGLGSYSQVT